MSDVKEVMHLCHYTMKLFKIVINNDACQSVIKQNGGYLLQASVHEHEHESSLEAIGNEAY